MKIYTPMCIMLCMCIQLNAQPTVNWSVPIAINQTGYDWPRIEISNDSPVITWGDMTSGNIYMKRKVSGNFTNDVQLNPVGFQVVVNGLTGPDLKASGDTIYVTYVDGNATHVYLQRSTDGGSTFSDTIKVDNIGSDIPQYPSVDIMPGGNPVVSFARLNSGFSNPQYVVTKSFDAGNTFLPDVSATATLGADPCDCCPGYIAYKDNKCAVIYRNSINDLRDFRAAISTDSANTFTSLGIIDNNNWVDPVCPSSGGLGIIEDDTLISVFMNGKNGPTCFISTLNVNTLQMGFEKKLMDGAGFQKNPRIVANGDTIGVVWDEVVNGNRNIMFSYSVTGASGIGVQVDTLSDIIPNGFHAAPDIAFSNGKFYIVFNDQVTAQLFYMEGTINGTSGLQTYNSAQPDIKFVSGVDVNSITILSSKNFNKPVSISIYNASGKVIGSQNLSSLKSSQTINIQAQLSDEMYIIKASSSEFNITQKLMIVHR